MAGSSPATTTGKGKRALTRNDGCLTHYHIQCITIWFLNHTVIELTPGARLDATFAALADPTRRAILARLARGEASVAELAEPFAISQPAISKHLKVLERAGLVSTGADAQRRPRKLEAKPLAAALGWIERYREFWDPSYDRLDALLEVLQAKEGKPSRRRKLS